MAAMTSYTHRKVLPSGECTRSVDSAPAAAGLLCCMLGSIDVMTSYRQDTQTDSNDSLGQRTLATECIQEA